MKCSHCGSISRLVKYAKNRRGDIQYFYCNKCNTERLKKYRKTTNGIKNTRKAVKKYESNNQDKRRAWNIASWGITKSKKNIRDINKPLEIIYLCPFHHKQIDSGKLVV